MSALTRRPTGGVSIAAQNLDPIKLGEVLSRSGFFQDSRDAAQAAVKVMAGAELGFGPVASMTGIYIVKGRVTLSANLMAAAIKAHPRYTYRVKEHSESKCSIEFREDGEPIGVSTFTMDDAKRAGLAGDNWRKYAKNMLFARALSNGAKWYCPDAFGGGPVYTPDELDVAVDGETGEVLEPHELAPPSGPAPEPEVVDAPEPAPEQLDDATLRRLKELKAEAGVSNDWLRMQLVASGVQDVPQRVTEAVIRRLSLTQAHQLMDVLNIAIDENAGGDD